MELTLIKSEYSAFFLDWLVVIFSRILIYFIVLGFPCDENSVSGSVAFVDFFEFDIRISDVGQLSCLL